jgi:hypothetical protein
MRAEQKKWVHVMRELKPRNGYYARMRFFGLIEEKGDVPEEDKKASGYWTVTQRGMRFIHGEITIPKYIEGYNNRKYGESEEQIDIRKALGSKFNYSEVMGKFARLPELHDQQALF